MNLQLSKKLLQFQNSLEGFFYDQIFWLSLRFALLLVKQEQSKMSVIAMERKEHFISMKLENEQGEQARRGAIKVVYWISYGKFALRIFFFYFVDEWKGKVRSG